MMADSTMASDRTQMARCLLSDIPDALFQVSLRHMSSQDLASLRRLDPAACQRTTQFLPHISLPLSESITAEQLQQWYQAIRPFKHVVSIHVRITGEVPADTFEQAVQLLLQFNIAELRILGCDVKDDTGHKTARLTTLQPLKRLMPQLQNLVIKGIAFRNLTAEMKQLAAASTAAGGWPLQNLTLDVAWCHRRGQGPCLWPCFSTAMMHLATAFSKLQSLALGMPAVGMDPEAPAAADLCCDDTIPGGTVKREDAAVVFTDNWAWRKPMAVTALNSKTQAASALVAALAAVGNAAMQLVGLKVLTVTGAPDVWRPVGQFISVDQGSEQKLQVSAIALAAQLAATQEAHAEARLTTASRTASCYPVLLPSVSAATAAFGTMDDFGCWLLQQHPALEDLRLSCAHISSWSMSWRQQQQLQAGLSDDTIVASEHTADLVRASADWHMNTLLSKPLPSDVVAAEKAGVSTSANSSSRESLSAAYVRHLSHYSARPVSVLNSRIGSYRLCMYAYQIEGMAAVLADWESVRHLEVEIVPCPYRLKESVEQSATIAAVRAAAALPGLRLLTISVKKMYQLMPADLLLPLTAAAVGPGSSLQSLKLSGIFTDMTTSLTIGCADTSADCAWVCHLKQLRSLRELSIINQGSSSDNYILSVGSLPATLEVFEGHNLYITNTKAAISKRRHKSHRSRRQVMTPCAAPAQMQLRSLRLNDCHLSSPSALASNQLKQLTIIDSSWSGGWAPAVAAWPYVREFVLIRDEPYRSKGLGIHRHYGTPLPRMLPETESEEAGSNSGSSFDSKLDEIAELYVATLVADAAIAEQVIHDMSPWFSNLVLLTMQNMPWLNVDVLTMPLLQRVLQQIRSMRQLRLGVHERYVLMPREVSCRNDYDPIFEQAVCQKISSMGSAYDAKATVEALHNYLVQQLPCVRVLCDEN